MHTPDQISSSENPPPMLRVRREFADRLYSTMRKARWTPPCEDGETVTREREKVVVSMDGVTVERELQRTTEGVFGALLRSQFAGTTSRAKGALLKPELTVGSNTVALEPKIYFDQTDTDAHKWLDERFGLNVEDPLAFQDLALLAYSSPEEQEGLNVSFVYHAQKMLQESGFNSSLYMILTECVGVHEGAVRRSFGTVALHFAREYNIGHEPYRVTHQMQINEGGVLEQRARGDYDNDDFRYLHRVMNPSIPLATSHLPISTWLNLLSEPLTEDQVYRREQ